MVSWCVSSSKKELADFTFSLPGQNNLFAHVSSAVNDKESILQSIQNPDLICLSACPALSRLKPTGSFRTQDAEVGILNICLDARCALGNKL